jgi:guanosine-3',5'-bis(diphosphate) 3'-pyrophosphohydrolase
LLVFLVGLKLTGIDEVGIVNNITGVVSSELNVNIRSLQFESNDGIFEGTMMVYVDNTNHLEQMINKLKKVNGISKVIRLDEN